MKMNKNEDVEERIKETSKEGLEKMEARKGKTAIKILEAIEDVERRDKARGRS